MIILSKDKVQKNEYIFLDQLGQLGPFNKKKVILTKNLWLENKQLLLKKKKKLVFKLILMNL